MVVAWMDKTNKEREITNHPARKHPVVLEVMLIYVYARQRHIPQNKSYGATH